MDIYTQVIIRIIKEQQNVIGPLAVEQAKKVEGLTISGLEDISIRGNGKMVLEHLVSEYEKLFGKASVEVCRDAIEPLRDKIPSGDLPDILS